LIQDAKVQKRKEITKEMTQKVDHPDHPEPTPISSLIQDAKVQKRKELTKEMAQKVDHSEPTPIPFFRLGLFVG
jgi:hypothetical protein